MRCPPKAGSVWPRPVRELAQGNGLISFHVRPGLCWLSGLAACCSHKECVDSTNVRVCCLPAFASGGVSGTQWGRLHPRPRLVEAGTCFAVLSLCLCAPAGPGSVSALTTASCRAWGARPALTRLAHSTRVLGGRRCVWLWWPAPRPDMVGGRLMRRGLHIVGGAVGLWVLC